MLQLYTCFGGFPWNEKIISQQVQPRCPAFMRSSMVSDEHAKNTHKQTSKENELIFHLASCPKSWGAAFNYLDKELRKRWACCGSNNWSSELLSLRLLFVFMEKPTSQFVFGKEPKWQKQVVFGHFFNIQEPADFMKEFNDSMFDSFIVLINLRIMVVSLSTGSMVFFCGKITLMNPNKHPHNCPTLDLTSNSSSFRLKIILGWVTSQCSEMKYEAHLLENNAALYAALICKA